MLPESVESLLREQIDSDLAANKFRPPHFSQRALMKSVDGGGLQPAKLAAAVRAEIALAGATIVKAMQKVLGKAPLSPYDELADDLLKTFDREFEPTIEAIRAFCGDHFSQISPSADPLEWFRREAERIKSAHRIEVKLMAAEITKPETKGNETVILKIQNSQIGVIQTGKGATVAGTTIGFTSEQTQQIIGALRDLYGQIEHVESLRPVERAELRDIAVEVQTELQKSNPNGTKVKGLLSMILAGIKGVGTLADVYSKIETALKILGIGLFT